MSRNAFGKGLLIVLLLANAALFAFGWLQRGNGEGMRLEEQIQPNKIRLLTTQQVAALGPSKVEALADVCLEWGPFSDQERGRALAALGPSGLGRLLTPRRIESTAQFWVFLPRSPNRGITEKRVAQLKEAGLKEITVVDAQPLRFTIGLGFFHSEESAALLVADLHKQGIEDAQVGPRQQLIPATQFVIRDPEADVVARVRELQAAYPGTDIAVRSCTRSGGGPCAGDPAASVASPRPGAARRPRKLRASRFQVRHEIRNCH